VINITQVAGATIINKDLVQKFRKPNLDDGAEVWKLIKRTAVLDLNSSYSYLMWCKYFSDTSVIIEVNDDVVGFVSAFIKPSSPNTLFVWQVVVDKVMRGKGLASKMIHHLLARESCEDIKYIEATVSPSNIPSRKLFHGLAKELRTDIKVSKCFVSKDFPEKGHEDELTHQIGPFNESYHYEEEKF